MRNLELIHYAYLMIVALVIIIICLKKDVVLPCIIVPWSVITVAAICEVEPKVKNLALVKKFIFLYSINIINFLDKRCENLRSRYR